MSTRSSGDAASLQTDGATRLLALAAADKLHMPLQLDEYRNSDEIAAAAAKDAWDIAFIPTDAEREKYVNLSSLYVAYESTYLVRAGSDINTVADIDRRGIRVGVIEGTAPSLAVARSLKRASLATFPKPEAAAELVGKGQLDALAMGTDALIDLAKGLPGTRVLDEPIRSTGVVVMVPKDRAAARNWAASFVEEAKRDGTVRRGLDSTGFVFDASATQTKIIYGAGHQIRITIERAAPPQK
jgi:polar amino acid transport system substrate-binding protein